MANLSNDQIIQMLAAAAQDEHAAIIQYLRHAYMMGEGELACEIEGIAREEMRHFWILSRWIVQLGGQPTIERGFTDLAGATIPEWMQHDVEAEDRAIAMYTDYIARIEDPDLQADLEYILGDEERHHGDCVHCVDKTQNAGPDEVGEDEEAEGPLDATDKEALSWGVSHEYAAILQYLVHSFLLEDQDAEISAQLEKQAINEMQHFGWLGEGLAEYGHEIPLEHHGVTLPQTPLEMLDANVKLEQDTAAMYAQYIPKMSDPGLKGVVDDARGQELYHESLFSRLAKRLGEGPPAEGDEDKPTSRSWTIGTLKKGD